jgi:hypothetical protein
MKLKPLLSKCICLCLIAPSRVQRQKPRLLLGENNKIRIFSTGTLCNNNNNDLQHHFGGQGYVLRHFVPKSEGRKTFNINASSRIGLEAEGWLSVYGVVSVNQARS